MLLGIQVNNSLDAEDYAARGSGLHWSLRSSKNILTFNISLSFELRASRLKTQEHD